MKIQLLMPSGPEMIRVTFGHYDHTPECDCGMAFTKATQAFISVQEEDGRWNEIHSGTAFCHPLDTFNKEKGRKLALAKALQMAGWDKSARIQVWAGYFAR